MNPVHLNTAYNAALRLDTYSKRVNPVRLSDKAAVDTKVFYAISDLHNQLHRRLTPRFLGGEMDGTP